MTLKEYVAAFGIPMLEEMPQLDEGGWLPTIHYLDASGNAEKEPQIGYALPCTIGGLNTLRGQRRR